MEIKEILGGLKSSYIFDIIFSYIKNKNYKYKLFIHSKTFQNKNKINLFDYQRKYINKIGIKIYTYFSSKYYSKFEKENLKNKFREDSLTFNVTKEVFQNYLDDFFKNYHKKNCFLIDIYSPFFEFLSTKEYFKELFSIQANLDSNLENDYIMAFDKLNKLKSEYSSLDFFINHNINFEIDKWKKYNINTNQIKKLNIFETYENNDLKDKLIEFIRNIINFENFKNNLKEFEIHFKKYCSFNSSSIENINNFKNLEILKLSGLHFSSAFILNLYNLKELELTN